MTTKNEETPMQSAVAFARMPAEEYNSLLSELKALKLSLESSEQISSIVEHYVGSGTDDAGVTDSFVLNTLYIFADRGDAKLPDVIENILADAVAEFAGEARAEEELNTLRERTVALSQLTPAITSIKAAILLSEREKILTDSQIFTDLRPIFTDTLTDNTTALILSTLKLEYWESAAKKTLHIALDENDIEQLIIHLDRAKRKIEALKSNFQSSNLVVVE